MASPRKHPAVKVAGGLARGFRWPLMIYGLIYVLMFAAVQLAMSIFNMSEDSAASLWGGFGISPKMFLLVLGILLTPFMLPAFVANGVTRKRFVQGTTLMIALLSVLFALLATAAYPLAAYFFDQAIWSEQMDYGQLFTSSEQYGIIFLDHVLQFFTYFVTGWMFGSLFYRFDWKWATVLLFPAMAPFIVVEAALSVSGIKEHLGLSEGGAVTVGVLISFAVAAITVWLVYSMLKQVAIKKKAWV